jgi:RimJ/RimL family protein N-acetyltransferase
MIELIGEKVNIRTIHEDDLPDLWRLMYGEKNPEWKKWDAPYYPFERQPYDHFVVTFSKNIEGDLPRFMAIEIEGTLKGTVSYYWEYKPTKWLECGIAIYDPDYWAEGYGTEAVRLWVDYLFKKIEIPRIGLTTWSGNRRMMRCAEKCGFTLEGRLRKVRYYNGTYYDSMRYGVLREEWEEKKKLPD